MPDEGRSTGLQTTAIAALALTALAGLTALFAPGMSSLMRPPPDGAPRTDAVRPARLPGPTGHVDLPVEDNVLGPSVRIIGWALDPSAIRGVEVRVAGRSYPAQLGFHRPDVARAMPGYPGNDRGGFVFDGDWPELSGSRQQIEIVAVGESGETVLGRKVVEFPARPRHWSALLDERPELSRAPLHFLLMASAISESMANDVGERYRQYLSRTIRIGISVPILYMRNTRGAIDDWTFDPTFDTTRRCGTRPVAEDNLDRVLRISAAKRIPIQIILNGGIWSDASCESPEWDLTDHLEQDASNVQWTQDNRTFPDGYLKGQAGSTESPELARSLTYHVYAHKVREYKRRNLQAAAALIAEFAREHPDLLVGIALDADTYMNPFLRQGGHSEIFDYNPGMLRQFREWLRGTGPYAGRGTAGVPDLRAYRRAQPLTLSRVNRLARRQWTDWDQVDPPRRLPGYGAPLGPGEQPIWENAWWHEWDKFRKHVIDLHYDELSTWAHQAGIPRRKIFSAQGGFMEPDPGLRPLSIKVTETGEPYDSAGVSVEGSIPRDGHLGAILYGPAARNQIRMAGPHSLFATFARLDEGWGVVEFNPTDLRRPMQQTDYATAYRALREMFNFGARQISVMAWNGSNGLLSFDPGFVPYTAWRNTPGEDAMRDLLDARADIPPGAWLWTFGSARHATDDGWTLERGQGVAGKGHLLLTPDSGSVVLDSPRDLVVRADRVDTLLLRMSDPGTLRSVRVLVRERPDRSWHTIAVEASPGRRLRPDGNHAISLTWTHGMLARGYIAEQLRIVAELDSGNAATRLERIGLYPRAEVGEAEFRDGRPAASARTEAFPKVDLRNSPSRLARDVKLPNACRNGAVSSVFRRARSGALAGPDAALLHGASS